MKKLMTIMAVVVLVFTVAMDNSFGAASGCCAKQKTAVAVSKAKGSCPKLQGMTAVEKKVMMAKCQQMIQNCPNLKSMSSADMAQAMQNCPKLKAMSDADKKIMLGRCQKMVKTCPKLKGMSPEAQKIKMQKCPSLQKKSAMGVKALQAKCAKMKESSDANKKTTQAKSKGSIAPTVTNENCPWYKRWIGMHNTGCTNN